MNKYKKKDAPPSDCNGDRLVTVSEFDYCMGNHFRAIKTISKLCGEDDEDYYALQQTEIQRLSFSLTFLRSILNNAPPTFKFYIYATLFTSPLSTDVYFILIIDVCVDKFKL